MTRPRPTSEGRGRPSPPLAELAKRYLLTLTRRSAACSLRHAVEERVGRWLLMTQGRVGSDTFYLTQEFLGIMLGVRRQTVSLVAARAPGGRADPHDRGT